MDISIIGSGAVGSRTGMYFLEQGYDVTFYDVVDKPLRRLRRHLGSGPAIAYTRNISKAIGETEVSIVAVPTPLNETKSGYDYSYLKSAAEKCGKALREKKDYHTLILKSTVEPGTTRSVFIPTLERYSEKKAGEDFDGFFQPEFLTVIDDKLWGAGVTPANERKVFGVGEWHEYDGENYVTPPVVRKLYPRKRRLVTNFETAEVAKLLSNSRLPLAISFSNEMDSLLHDIVNKNPSIEIDVHTALKIMNADRRIGDYGSVTADIDVSGKGTGGYGGPCFTKDPLAFAGWVRSQGKRARLIEATIAINEKMKKKHGVRE